MWVKLDKLGKILVNLVKFD